MENKRYFQLIQNDDAADLYIFGDICGWAFTELGEQSGVTIVEQLKAVNSGHINVHINSYGGDVAEGLAIYNVLRNHAAHITTICDGFACSAASVVFMAGDDRIMSPASLLMIHNAWTAAVGNADELRKAADDIETITQASVAAYMEHATIPEEEVKKLMDAETWILPVDAVEMGFATAVAESQEDGKAKQSAFTAIMKKLTAKTVPEFDIDDLAERISVCLATRKKPQKEPEAEPAPEKEPEDTEKKPPVCNRNGWDEFFKMKGK